jgi:SAM-dependent methyltransferase
VSPSGARELGRVFADADVVRNYRYRQPYPPETFDILERLLVEPRTVLDAGSGTGALTIGLARFAKRVDAVDPSEAMHREGRRTPGGDSEHIRRILGTAETAPLDPPYGLITAGASIHWMDPDVVMPRFRDALAPGAVLAIVNSESEYAKHEWRDELIGVIQRFSPSTHHLEFVDLVRSLEASGHFTRHGERAAAAVPYEQSLDDYMAMLASTSSLSRTTLGGRADDFERGARAVFARHNITSVRAELLAEVVWGRPQ